MNRIYKQLYHMAALFFVLILLIIIVYNKERSIQLEYINPMSTYRYDAIEADIVEINDAIENDSISIVDRQDITESKEETIEPDIMKLQQDTFTVKEKLETPSKRFWNSCTITYYCNCPLCCGKWAYGNTASGSKPTEGRTVACGDLPFGTRIMIDDHEYIVEDRGVNGAWIDIYVESHERALQLGMRTADVYILD